MGSRKSRARSAAAWEMARRQHGVVTRRGLEALGFTRKAIEHRVKRGRLRPVTRGVYAVGWLQLSREGRWMAAVLAAGEGAALSHSSAAALWGISVERVLREGIPVTSPVRTLLDQATELHPRALERMVNEADKRDLVDPEALRVALDGCRGEPGVRPLRTLLDRQTFRRSRPTASNITAPPRPRLATACVTRPTRPRA